MKPHAVSAQFWVSILSLVRRKTDNRHVRLTGGGR